MQLVLTPELLLEAYKQGLFPMSYSADSPYIHWVCPEMRGQLSITEFHMSGSLKKSIKNQKIQSGSYQIKINSNFRAVIQGCAEPTPDRPETWINDTITEAFTDLHKAGHAHSIEVWQDTELVGGLYGLALGGAFFGESMFSRVSNGSKVALAHLVARLWKAGFTMLDTQFVNDHLIQFGVYEIPYEALKTQLDDAIEQHTDFALDGMVEHDLIREYLDFRG